jgi:hypothetical protein
MEHSRKKPVSKLRRPCVIMGAVTGATLSIWYLCTNFGRSSIMPDPVWAKFVNVALLMFCSIYLFNLLRRLVEFILKKTRLCKN